MGWVGHMGDKQNLGGGGQSLGGHMGRNVKKGVFASK